MAEIVIGRSVALNHHHEIVWMVWLLIVVDIEISASMVDLLSKSRNAHIRALLVQAYIDRKIRRKPKLALGAPLSTVDDSWLLNLVARSQEFSRAAFSGNYANEFGHLASRNIRLIDFDDHIEGIRKENKQAISRTRYGYDDDSDEDENEDEPLVWEDFL